MTTLRSEVQRVIDAGALGRSASHIRLLNYLADATERGKLPKEVDIAADVFGRADFDATSDSTVRVYVHNLRQKLDTFYEVENPVSRYVLSVPRGKYQLALEERRNGRQAADAGARPAYRWIGAGAAILAMAAFLLGRALAPSPPAAATAFASVPAWRAILDDRRPVTVVVGDYFIFSEAEDGEPGQRLIRDFSINSAEDFQNWLKSYPDLQSDYVDIRLTYLPTGIAAALNDVFAVLRTSPRRIAVVPQSQFQASLMRESHIVYVGYLSGMGQLAQYPLLASRLRIGASFDELIDRTSGARYESSAGVVTESGVGYEDYGYVSTFPGPSGNQFLYVTGMRDEGLMHMASTLGNADKARTLGHDVPAGGEPAFEALYQVSGIDRTYLNARELFESPVDVSRIWMDDGGP